MSNELLTQFKEFRTSYESKFAGVDEKLEQHQAMLKNLEAELTRPGGGGGSGPEVKTLSSHLWENADFKSWAQTGKGRFAMKLSGEEFKTAITSTAVGSSTPGILVPERTPGIVTSPVRRVRVRDLIPAYPTSSNACEYVQESAFTNAASPTAETISKPESAVTFQIQSVPVRTIAHWVPATRQILDDFSELRAYLDVRLVQKLKDIEDSELLSGDGTGQHLSGLLTEASAYDTSRTVSGDTRLDTASHAFSQLEEANFYPDGLVVSPADWRQITRVKDEAGGTNTGSYLMGSPTQAINQALWGKNVAVTTAMPAGFFLAGAFAEAAAIRDRMDATVMISDSHDDYFIRNMLAILCEERLALQIFQPGGLVYGSF